MKLKKFIAVMATVGMVASLAVGCGGSSEDTSAEGGDAAAEGSSDWDSSMREYKQRYVVRFNDRIVPVQTTDIAYFYSEEKNTYLVTSDNNLKNLAR